MRSIIRQVRRSIGDLGCFSFYPGKNLVACGEGGLVVTSEAVLADKIWQLRDWGQSARYVHVLQGFNYRLDVLQAVFLNISRLILECLSKRNLTVRPLLAGHGCTPGFR